jgi:hypothetical protein
MIRCQRTDLTQAWPRPSHPRPIVIIGAGGIVRAAHLPTYRALGFPVAGLFDAYAPTPRDRPPTPLRSTRCSRRSPTRPPVTRRDLRSRGPGDQILGILAQLPAAAAC